MSVVSLFSGALGLDLGLERAGFDLRYAIECDPSAQKTIAFNASRLKKDVTLLPEFLDLENIAEISRKIRKEVTPFILSGAPPCQPFSTAGRRKSLQDTRSEGWGIFTEAIKILQPKFFVIENVKGLLSAAKIHRPLNRRGFGFPPLSADEQFGSAFLEILTKLENFATRSSYCITWGLINAADFGCAQSRERVVFIGSKDGRAVWPDPTHDRLGKNGLENWRTLRQGLDALVETNPNFFPFSKQAEKHLKLLKGGQNWRHLPEKLQPAAIGGAFNSWGGRSGFLRRLDWNRPCPTITNRPHAPATTLCHPDVVRPLSVRECARIQGFPDFYDWSSLSSRVKLQLAIANAVPPPITAYIVEQLIREQAL